MSLLKCHLNDLLEYCWTLLFRDRVITGAAGPAGPKGSTGVQGATGNVYIGLCISNAILSQCNAPYWTVFKIISSSRLSFDIYLSNDCFDLKLWIAVVFESSRQTVRKLYNCIDKTETSLKSTNDRPTDWFGQLVGSQDSTQNKKK